MLYIYTCTHVYMGIPCYCDVMLVHGTCLYKGKQSCDWIKSRMKDYVMYMMYILYNAYACKNLFMYMSILYI